MKKNTNPKKSISTKIAGMFIALGFILAAMIVTSAVNPANLFEGSVAISFASVPFLFRLRQLSPDGGAGSGSAELTAEQKQLLSVLNESVKDSYKTLIGESLSEKQFNELESVKKLNDRIKACVSKEDYDKLKQDMEAITLKVNAIKEPAKSEKQKSFAEQVQDALTANKAAIDAMIESKSAKGFTAVLKTAGTMSTSNVTAIGTNGISALLNQFEGMITPVPRSAPFFSDLLSNRPVTGSTYSYAEIKNNDGGAGMTAEGSAKTQADFDIVEAKVNVRKVTSYIKVSKEALADIPALAAEINNELLTLVRLKADSQALTGDNTGQNLNGVLTQATAFTGGALAGTIANPNNFDVLVAAITQIATAEVISGEPAGFLANTIVMHPADVAAMQLTKSTTGEYVFPVTLPGQPNVVAVPVVQNARITAGTFLVMDSSKATFLVREGITIDIGYEQDDFTKNLITVLAEMRCAVLIKSQHVKAFVTGSFSTAIATLASA